MQNWIGQHPAATAVIFPVYFVALWLFVSGMISYIGGWSALAKHYRLTGQFTGERWSFQSGKMRWLANYNNCLTIGASQTGLFLGILFLFRFRHPPLLIPWSEVSVGRKEFWVFKYAVLRLGRELGIPLSIRGGLADKLKDASGGKWPIEPIG
jgi:hypothetical protein